MNNYLSKHITLLVFCILSSVSMATTRYVDINNPSPIFPYTSLSSASTNIQTAVDAASHGDTILVNEGIYEISKEIFVGKNIHLKSINGYENTVIDGGDTVRCLNLTNSSCTVEGFTIQYGRTTDGNGGGILCADQTPLIKDCFITTCWAWHSGGGIYQGHLEGCIISGNEARIYGGGLCFSSAKHSEIRLNTCSFKGGGTYYSTVTNCVVGLNHVVGYGGGIYGGTADNSIIYLNTSVNGGSGSAGGGLYAADANNCVISGNTAQSAGGASSGTSTTSTLRNCTVIKNRATAFSYGGTRHVNLLNSIVWNNTAIGDYDNHNYPGITVENTCSPDAVHGANGNITNAPSISGNTYLSYRLAFDSLCIDNGSVAHASGITDVDGNHRLKNNIDIGAYEYRPETADSDDDGSLDSWELHYFGNVTGSIATADTDGDSMSNIDEYIAGTDPTNKASLFVVTNTSIITGALMLEWQSVTNRKYHVRWAESIDDGYYKYLWPEITYPDNSFTDSVEITNGHGFYKVDVELID